jgi:PDZ domain-containing protein
MLAFVALLPVPWMRVPPDHAPGTAWHLDGRLAINEVVIDPPGDWYWLTAGRPPIVAEIVHGWLVGDDDAAMNMIAGRRAGRPAVVEPAAAAAGLRRAGWPVAMGVTVEASEPLSGNVPARVVVDTINGQSVSTRAAWEAMTAALGERNTFADADGTSYEFTGHELPYRRVDVIDTPTEDLNVAIGGPLARTALGSRVRQLSLGSSHGLIVALVSYVHAAGEDLAAGRTIAATGKIGGDGRVGSIGGLQAKAAAARDVGADVLVFPAGQRGLLEEFDPGTMKLCPVGSLDEAIEALGSNC